MFFRRFADADAADVRFVGLLHDIPLSLLVERFGGRDPERVGRIVESWRKGARRGCRAWPGRFPFRSLTYPTFAGWWRCGAGVLSSVMRVYDCESGEYAEGEYSGEAEERLRRINAAREAEDGGP